ncbi:MAG: thiamine pyrophosphate-dependent enzyme [Anaerolineales bacterium]|nr:thiamine pyrophosphate-dependent enzyme [Anaerolineales bacterium]MDW8160467.1 thiamine pyrophosphate-dependent enzyme [Anaerolineales bacterium]
MEANHFYRLMCRIRFFEELVLEKFPSGVFVGTTHTYLGQEANAVGVVAHLRAEDIIFSNHRGHGHFLAFGGDPRALFAELMGKRSGVCGGRGGSQHLHWRNFYSNGVQGGIVPIATGMAFAEKIKRSGGIAVAFLGDGTLGEGVIYEAFNMASKWNIPVLYVVENNRIAQTTPIELTLAGTIAGRFQAFGIAGEELETCDVLDVYQAAGRWVAQVRETQSPAALILHTYRFGPHSKGDDTRPAEEVARLWEVFDPLKVFSRRLSAQERAAIEAEERERIQQAFEAALRDEYPLPSELGRLGENVLVPTSSSLMSGDILTLGPSFNEGRKQASGAAGGGKGIGENGVTVVHSLNRALRRALAENERVYLIGQDLLDPYGGAFKVTQGCSTEFPNRVIPTPISEAGLVGIAAGMAMRGLLPVAEIMFGDFLTLIADQVINHIAKFRWTYGEAVKVPLVIRTPVGGGRGYGPTHSQSLEKLYLGVPGIHVVAVTHFGSPQDLLLHALWQDEDPVILIEHKSLYPLPLFEASDPDFEREVDWTALGYPVYTLRLRGAPPPILSLIAYGYAAELARKAMLQLAYREEIFCELVVPTQLNPCESKKLLESVRRTGRAIVIEEGTLTLGWGAEVLARLAEQALPSLLRVARIATADCPIPASPPLEKAVLPSVEAIVQKAIDIL